MSGWNNSMSENHGGWGGDSSFATSAPQDSSAQRLGDRVPLPVTVSELILNDSTDDKFHVGPIGFSTVMFIGLVDSLQEFDGGTMLKINVADPEDDSKVFPVHLLKTFEDDSNANVIEGTMIMVVGKPRNALETASLLVLKTREITDRREYEAFKLEVQIAKLLIEKSVSEKLHNNEITEHLRGCPAGPPAGGTQGPGMNTAASQQMSNASQRIYNTSAAPTNNTVAGIRQKILDYLTEKCSHSDNDEGVSIGDISKHLKLSINEANDHLNYLTSEGTAYNTIDDKYATF